MSNPTPPLTIPAFSFASALFPRMEVELPDPQNAAVLKLSAMERATIKVRTVPLAEVALGRGMLPDAAFRLALAQHRGELETDSGRSVAQRLQAVFYPHLGNGLHHAKRGWIVLAALDAADLGVTVTLDADPLSTEPDGPRRPMRLNERVDEIGAQRGLVAASSGRRTSEEFELASRPFAKII